MNEFLQHLDAIVTFIVGFFAIFLYLKQKNNDKRVAAQLILQEIRYAEQQINNVRSNPNQGGVKYGLEYRLLPTNSWHKNIHLFVKTLEETQIDTISQFYARAIFIDAMIEKVTDKKTDVSFEELDKANCIDKGTLQPNLVEIYKYLDRAAMI